MFETVIGLEVHAQLNTKSKLWCNCATSFGEKANTNVCPVCLGLPGALPVLNEQAVKKSIELGTALKAPINKKSIFNRKNYFYPDLPTGYQISQFEIPIVGMGEVVINFDNGLRKTIGVTRAHLENDAGKNIHDNFHSKVDLNRAGTPLLEIVSEPDMRSAEEAILYLKKIHSIVRYINISDANMQEGSFRADVNVSIRPKGDDKLYTRCEIKNMNSFKFIEKAIAYEVYRQTQAWEDGTYDDEVVQETRLFDLSTGKTRSMRGKEDSADYRYFPDPDLPPLIISDEMIDKYSKIPELPDAKKQRFIESFGMSQYDAEVICSTKEMAKYFENMLDVGINAKMATTWLSVELLGRFSEGMNVTTSPVNARKLGTLVKAIEDGIISGKAGKEILDYIMDNDISVNEAIDKLGLKQVSDDGEIINIINQVLEKNPQKVQEFKDGKDKLFGFFVGQVMKASKGKANPVIASDLLKDLLK